MSKKNIAFVIIIILTLLLLVDRYYWAQISQWREDQATNMWLGYTNGIRNIPVGLISSQNIPNPNGMILLGGLLSILPNLLTVSFFLGSAQIFLLILVGWKSFGKDWFYFALATLPSLTSVILRSTSVELWNQYTIGLINIFFIFWVIRYLEKPTLWNLPPILLLILLAPSLYLAGIVNALAMILITLGMLIYKRPATNNFWLVVTISVLLLLISIFLTWFPYFQNVEMDQIFDLNKTKLGPVAGFKAAWEFLFGIPNYVTFQWADKDIISQAFKHSDTNILTPPAQILLRLVGRTYLLQAVFAFVTFGYAVFSVLTKKDTDYKTHTTIARLVSISVLFIVLSYTFSAWLGGPAWVDGERPDQNAQFFPLFLFIIFLLPFTISMAGRPGKIIIGISYFSLLLFSLTNIFTGAIIIRDHLNYDGSVITEADVPLQDKSNAVDFIAEDWKSHSISNIIPVDYDLGGGRWDWVPEFGVKLLEWYSAPMTGGRSFDYELLRQHGLINRQEGIQLRTFGTGKYLVTYAFDSPPVVKNKETTHHIFGRLRVSVVE
ncbi:MAG TPA: hypothetical protein VLA72_11520 [Anaerolineales bacterium]|nr:hypothetical protein [Anaerolineales bacterium]